MTMPPPLFLPTVTLCAATSVNLAATVEALSRCLGLARFAECLLFTDRPAPVGHAEIRTVPIARMESSRDYSTFMLKELVHHVRSNHVLVVQWDGFILDPGCWDDHFLVYDYIGAPWPQFSDGAEVGNGGFSLRSRRLLEACLDPAFQVSHPEDVAICRSNRPLLEKNNAIRFAPAEVATRFAFERSRPAERSFGFHGIFNMVPAIGADPLWATYLSLDDRRTAFQDLGILLRQLGGHPGAGLRQLRLVTDRLRALVERRGG